MEEEVKNNEETNDLKPNSPVDIVGWLGEGWELYKAGWPGLTLTAFVYLALLILAQMVPYIGNLLLAGPLTVGFYLVIADSARGKKFNLGRLFQGFAYFVPSLLANLIITIFTTLGFLLLIIPGLVVGGWYLMTYLFIIDRGLDYWSAMEASRKTAARDMTGMTIFFVTLGFLNILGALTIGIGLLVSLPVTTIAIFVGYKHMVGFETLNLEETSSASGTVTEPVASGAVTEPVSSIDLRADNESEGKEETEKE